MAPGAIRTAALAGVVLCLLLVRPTAGTADPSVVSSLPWLFDGPVRAATRLGQTLYVGGLFRFVAPSANLLPPTFALSSTTGGVRSMPWPATDAMVDAIEPDGAGGYFIGGNFTTPRPYVAHVLAGGALDTLFAPVLDGRVTMMARVGTTLWLLGQFTTVDGVHTGGRALVRIDDGQLMPSPPSAGSIQSTTAMAAAGDRVLLAGIRGAHPFQSGVVVAYEGATGTELWSTVVASRFREGGVAGPLVVSGNAIIVAGHLLTEHYLAKLALDTGAVESSWRVSVTARALAVDGATIYVAGAFPVGAGQAEERVTAVDVDTATLRNWGHAVSGPITGLIVSPSRSVFLRGDFDTVGSLPRSGLAEIDVAGAVTPWSSGIVTRAVVTMANGPSGSLLVSSPVAADGAVGRNRLAAFDLSSGALLPWAPDGDLPVEELAAAGPRVAVGTSLGGRSIDAVTGAALGAMPGRQFIADETWAYAFDAAGPIPGLRRSEVATGRPDAAWFVAAASPPSGAVVVDDALVISSADGLVAVDRRTARIRWSMSMPSLSRLAATGDTVYAYEAALGRIVALDARTGAFLQGVVALDVLMDGPENLTIADGRLLGDFRTLTAQTISLFRFDGRRVAWDPGAWLNQASTSLGGRRLGVVGDALVVVGDVRKGPPDPRLGMALFPLQGARAPSGLRARPRGPATAFTWSPPATAPSGGYVLEAGLASGGTVATLPLGNVTEFSVVVPAARFYVRVRTAGAVGGTEEVSNEILVTGGCAAAPPAPTGLRATLTGAGSDHVQFFWTAPDAFVSSYTLAAGSAPGLADIATIAVPGASPALSSASAIPAGTYHVRVSATNACGQSAVTPDLRVTIGTGTDLPRAPIDLTATASGGTATLSWTAPPGAITGYVLEAGSDAGLADVVTAPLGPTPGVVVPGVPSGVYTLRVRAVTAAGTGPPSADVVLRVP